MSPRFRRLLCFSLLLFCSLGLAREPLAQTWILPPDAGQIDVKKDYGALCNGVADDTDAFLRAIENARSNRHLGKRVIFVPAGTCLIRNQLPWREALEAGATWQQNLSLVGAGRDRTIIRLVDRAPGFQDPLHPRAVLYTASRFDPTDPPERNLDGSGNRAFHNHISDLTLDVGNGNPGAVGIDFLANNTGSIRNVRVRSTSGVGYAGIRMERYAPGPALLSHVSVDGFDYGIRVARFDYGLTLEHVGLTRQRVTGIYNSNNILSIRKLNTSESVPAIDNAGVSGLIVLADSYLQSGAAGSAAILNNGKLLLRNVRTSGYASVLAGTGPYVASYTTHGAYSAFEQDARSTLSLPVEETPVGFNSTDPSDWANVTSYGALPWDGIDDSDGFQRAMSSGKPIVYATTGVYHFSKSVRIPASVQLVHLAGSSLQPVVGAFTDPSVPSDFLLVEEPSASSLTLTRFWAAAFWGANALRHASSRVLIVKDVGLGSVSRIMVQSGAGKVFLEDSGAGSLSIGAGARVWARQLNLEARAPNLPVMSVNEGGRLWVLGLKTEMARTVNRTRSGGCTEVLGGLVYATQAVPETVPMFEVLDSRASFSYAETAYADANRYAWHLKESRSGATRNLLRTAFPSRGLASVVALSSAHIDACPQ